MLADGAWLWTAGHDLLARGVGQDQVGDDDVVGHRLGHELGDARRLSDDHEVGLVVEEEPDAGANHGVIVEDEDPPPAGVRSGRRSSPALGRTGGHTLAADRDLSGREDGQRRPHDRPMPLRADHVGSSPGR